MKVSNPDVFQLTPLNINQLWQILCMISNREVIIIEVRNKET
jgi:hypothetical protein